MKASSSTAAQVQRNNLAVAGTKAHMNDLPQSAAAIAEALEKRQVVIEKLNADQEAARAALKAATEALNKELKAGAVERQKLIRFAEATFGPRGPQIVQFRSKVDAKA